MLVDLRTVIKNLCAKDAQLEREYYNISKSVPNETKSPFQASGLRLSSPAQRNERRRNANNSRFYT